MNNFRNMKRSIIDSFTNDILTFQWYYMVKSSELDLLCSEGGIFNAIHIRNTEGCS